MVFDFTAGGSSLFNLLFFINGRQKRSPIVCFGGNREFLEYMTHNTTGGQYVS
jgi:hypothetical protein